MSGTDDAVKRRVVDYYEATTEASYLANWSGDSLGFHLGLADDETASLAESLVNTNRYLAERAGIDATTRVLDAGCGVGGSTLWLAREKGASVTGISLVARQVELARNFARDQGLEGRVSFECEDMLATPFAEASFDVVWNIESLCHVEDLAGYLRHVRYLLADGGRFACIDLCAGTRSDAEVERPVCAGWALAALRPPSEITEALVACGFAQVESVDLTEQAMRSALALESMASRSLLEIRADSAFFGREAPPFREGHVRAALAFVAGLKAGSASVTHFLARRPARG
jgi:tocopherol O-methyltransferase